MWVRSLRWLSKDHRELIRGSYLPDPDLFDDSTEVELDTSELDGQRLADLLPATGADLEQLGQLMVELVLDGSTSPDQLKSVLDVVLPFSQDDIVGYVLDEHGDDVTTVDIYQDESSEEFKWRSLRRRPFEVPELIFEGGDPKDPRVVVRTGKLIHSEQLFLVVWLGAEAFPSYPTPEEFGLEVEAALERGVPEEQATLEYAHGGRGPYCFGNAVARFDDTSSPTVMALAEDFFARLAEEIWDSAARLISAHERWELELHAMLAGDESLDHDDAVRPLSRLGLIANSIRNASRLMPTVEGDPPHAFERTSDSETLAESMADAQALLERFYDQHRDSLSLVSAVSAASALRIQEASQKQSEQVQRAVTIVSSAVLGPALVFGLFGANVPLPLGDSWGGFALILCLAALSALLIWLLLKRWTSRSEVDI
jgi:hypothetical protein